jgi:NDMA-dependent alcohol dehydrogenase
MQTRSAIVHSVPGKYEVVDLELEEPRQGELMVEVAAAGLCHTDDHVATGDMPVGKYPWCGGHEGSGVVVQVGPNTPGWREGDHLVFSPTGPFCGRCRWCASGYSTLCDSAANLLDGDRWDEPGSFRMTLDGQPVGQMCGVSTFSAHTTVAAEACLKVDDDLPLDVLGILGCCVGTGWGSVVNCSGARPGDTVIIMGIGGIGINAVQGAKHISAGTIIAVDPVAFKLRKAREFGATHTFASIEEAGEFARSVTGGHGADATIVTVGVTTPEHVSQAYTTIRKMGTLVLTGLGDLSAAGARIPLGDLILGQKRIQGNIYGACSPGRDIPRQIQMYRDGVLKLDELITTRYPLDDVARAYEDMHAGKNLRGLVVHNWA